MGMFSSWKDFKSSVTNLNVAAKGKRGQGARQTVGRGAVAAICGFFTGGASVVAGVGAGLWAGQKKGALTGKELLVAGGKGVVVGVGTSMVKSAYSVGSGGQITGVTKGLGTGVKSITGVLKSGIGLITTTAKGFGAMLGIKGLLKKPQKPDPSGLIAETIPNTSDNVTTSYWSNPLDIFRPMKQLFGSDQASITDDSIQNSNNGFNTKDLPASSVFNWINIGGLTLILFAIVFLIFKRR